MTIHIQRDRTGPMRQTVRIRDHQFTADQPVSGGGEDAGPDPHELYDSALGACKALTVLWYAQRKGLPLEDVLVEVERDGSQERQGLYQLKATLTFVGDLTDEQRQQLLAVAEKCPVHKLMTQVTTEIQTVMAG
ncbi:osmotically inducible protein OsmC [Roseateles chitinivorans]|uniref:Osmotically inducible protein OsmC n=1 Tax=Roseateles chitinivorans TaxID=2917965 RepID=A0A2G9C8F3_9BURK|nr:OsmC family protein [Roseateles chitinivorans]PIM52721.1 osmotically inducible protein OsmC [Roseateles chitinivorans]